MQFNLSKSLHLIKNYFQKVLIINFMLTELSAKIYEIENINKNLSIENIYYQNTFRKSINNYFFENQKHTNEMKRQKLLNKNTTINLFTLLGIIKIIPNI